MWSVVCGVLWFHFPTDPAVSITISLFSAVLVVRRSILSLTLSIMLSMSIVVSGVAGRRAPFYLLRCDLRCVSLQHEQYQLLF